jgi:hypothetical protein
VFVVIAVDLRDCLLAAARQFAEHVAGSPERLGCHDAQYA